MASQKVIAATTSATSVLAATTQFTRTRCEMIFENSDTNRCYVLIGSGTVSSSNYSFSLAQFEKVRLDNLTDQISVVWGTAAGGALMVTEWMN
jgi:hypothetical protein